MAWTIDGIRIFVDESTEEAGQIVPRLQPLAGATVLQVFGYESDIRNVHGLVVGDADKDDIKELRKGGTAALVGPEGSIGDFTVKKVSVSRVHCVCQTIRPDLAADSPVYEVGVELYE